MYIWTTQWGYPCDFYRPIWSQRNKADEITLIDLIISTLLVSMAINVTEKISRIKTANILQHQMTHIGRITMQILLNRLRNMFDRRIEFATLSTLCIVTGDVYLLVLFVNAMVPLYYDFLISASCQIFRTKCALCMCNVHTVHQPDIVMWV